MMRLFAMMRDSHELATAGTELLERQLRGLWGQFAGDPAFESVFCVGRVTYARIELGAVV